MWTCLYSQRSFRLKQAGRYSDTVQGVLIVTDHIDGRAVVLPRFETNGSRLIFFIRLAPIPWARLRK
jgi:hypothetical protein